MPKKNQCSCCEYYSQNQFERDMQSVALQFAHARFENIFGMPRGGLTPAVKLSHLLEIPLVTDMAKISKKTLMVDDIADTGKTLARYAQFHYSVFTIFYHRQSIFVPWYWLREKKEKYIIFPWEKQCCIKKPR